MAEHLFDDHDHRFHGGLKLAHHKQPSCHRPISRPDLPARLEIRIDRRRNAASRICVEVGQRLLGGEALSKAGDDFSVPDHAPTSGHVEAIVETPAVFPPGSTLPTVVLVPDGQDEWIAPQPLPDWPHCPANELVNHLHVQGLAGLGGAMFPTAAKLRGPWPAVETLILNGVECEPWIACDEMLMRERPEAVIQGGLILARAAGAKNIVIAIEDRMATVGDRLRNAVKTVAPDARIALRRVAQLFPQGGERQLIQTLTGREVPHQGLPQDLGVLVHSVATAAAACDAVIAGRPLVERVVTVSGPGIAEPRNLLALLGTPLSHLVEHAGGYQGSVSRLVLGGPMSGTALSDDRQSVTKGTNCILALTEDETAPTQPTMPCINCGECVRVCPAKLLPQTLYRLIEAGRHERADEYNLSACIECGCCAAVCPSHIPLVDYYRHGKDELIRRGIDRRQAALARRRHEARSARLEREREARRDQRLEREKTLKHSTDAAKNEIQAAIERARRKKEGPE